MAWRILGGLTGVYLLFAAGWVVSSGVVRDGGQVELLEVVLLAGHELDAALVSALGLLHGRAFLVLHQVDDGGVRVDRHAVAAQHRPLALDLTQDLVRDRLLRLEVARAVAVEARLVHESTEALARSFARHLDEAEFADAVQRRLRLVLREELDPHSTYSWPRLGRDPQGLQRRSCLVHLGGRREHEPHCDPDGRDLMLHIVEAVAAEVFIPLTVGGGVRTVDDVRRLLNAGADKVSINTAAVNNPQVVAEASGKVGSQCIVVAIDAKQVAPGRWEVFTHGGRNRTGLDAVEWALQVESLGAGEILLTSMDRDGTKNGFDLGLTRAVSDAVNIPVIASGGVGNLEHLADGVSLGRADAVLAASIFHFGDHTVREAKEVMRARGIEVRL